MNLLDVFLIVLLAAVLTAALFIIHLNKKNGKGCHSCGGDCLNCENKKHTV